MTVEPIAKFPVTVESLAGMGKMRFPRFSPSKEVVSCDLMCSLLCLLPPVIEVLHR